MHIKKTTSILGLLLCLTLLPAAGCETKAERQVRSAAETQLNQIKTADAKELEHTMDTQQMLPVSDSSQGLSENIADIFTLFYKDFSYDIKKITIKDKKATARTTLKVLDGKQLAKDFSSASLKKRIQLDAGSGEAELSMEDSCLLLKNLLKKKDYPTTSVTTDLVLTQKDDTWELNHTQELDSLLTGDFARYTGDPRLLSPSEIVKIHFKTIKGFDAEQLKQYLSLDLLLETDSEYSSSVAGAMADQIQKSFNFKIKEEDCREASALVRVSITSIDFPAIAEDYRKRISKWLKTSQSLAAGSQGRREKEKELLLTCISENTATVSHEVDIPLKNDGTNWKIQMNPEITQAVFGDIEEALSSMSQTITEGTPVSE